MATPNGAFEFVNGPARFRTPRIAPERWERHRPRITELYLAPGNKLADVVRLMELEHGFYAKERQYTHHLTTAIPSLGGLDDTSGLGQREPLKRRRPSASIHSFSSTDSALSRPPRKKVEQDAAVPSKPSSDVSSEDLEHGRVGDGSSWTASVSPIATNTTCQTGIASPATEMTGPKSVHGASVDGLSASPEAIDATTCHLDFTQQGDALDAQWPLPPIAPPGVGATHPTHDEAPATRLPTPPVASPPPPARTLRTIDRNRPIETFSAQDISDIKHAAECLSMLRCDQEAFVLYATILTRQLSDPTYRDKTFWYLVIQCAHMASIPEHVEVVQNIIRAELARIQQSQFVGYSTAIAFLLHMLLALTSGANRNPNGSAGSIAWARSYLVPGEEGLETIFQQLPLHDRSIDLAVYRNVVRLTATEFCDLISPIPFEFTPFGLWRENKVPLEEWILYRVPGPFELQKNGAMANPCVRSCISWCKRTLDIEHLRLSPITPGIANALGDKVGIAWAEANGLFIVLWEHWVTCTSDAESAWMHETQDRMGISATELLLIVCRIIYTSNYAWNTPANSTNELVVRLYRKAFALLQEPDLRLARRFLKQYISRNTATEWPSWRRAVQRLEKTRMISSFERAMLVRFPELAVTRDLIDSVLVPVGEESFPVVNKAQQLSLTLASSLKSDDLLSFKKAGVNAMLQFGKLTRGSSSIQSALFQARSETKMSTASVSDITTSFRSMSIYGESVTRKRASSQVVSTILSEGKRRSEQSGAERELESDRISVATWM